MKGRTLFTAAAARESGEQTNAGFMVRAIRDLSKARAEYSEGDVRAAYENVRLALNELRNAEAVLARELFVEEGAKPKTI